jgi:uncharacterized protein YutE (UPF0331/DUF86 family)
VVRVEVVREKVRRVRATLDALRSRLPAAAEAIAADRDVLDLVSFRFYLVVQDSVDIASHVIADEGWGPAPSLRDHFGILHQKGIIDASLLASLSSAIKVRNLIAHGYAVVDPAKLHAAATALQPIAESYCATVLAWAEASVSGT